MAAIDTSPLRTAAPSQLIEALVWESIKENTFECRVLVCPEDDGGFSALALRLPGVVSQGDTIDDALKNIAEAFRGAVLEYQNQGKSIPWSDRDVDRPKGSFERWILVNV